MATSEGIPSSIDIEFLELNNNPYYSIGVMKRRTFSRMTENCFVKMAFG